MHKTPEGFLLCIGVSIARTGIQEYTQGETPLEVGDDGIVKIMRDEKEVFRPETMASFEGKPLTIQHPEEFVSPENWKQLAKGTMMNVRRGEGADTSDLVCDLLITDALTISLVENGLRGLSCGYEAEYIQTGDGEGKQTKIIGNHLALVEEGRAGPSYAINDSKGAIVMSKKLGEKIKSNFQAMFTKVVDEAMKEEDAAPEAPAKKEGAMDADMYDELVKLCDAMNAKLDAMKPKDAAPPVEEKKDGEDADPASGMEDRLKALEMAVQKLMEAQSGDADPDAAAEAGDEEEMEDAADPDDVNDEDGMGLTGDTKSRIEILAPGSRPTKDFKVQALKTAYATKEGKEVIDQLTGGKAPAYDSKDKVEVLFTAASELLKSKRGGALARTKTHDFKSSIFDQNEDTVMTPEKLNKLNAERYKLN